MPYRYYILTTHEGIESVKEYFGNKGFDINSNRRRYCSDHFDLPGVTIYINIRDEKGLVNNIVEFESDEGNMEKLEEIAKAMQAVKVQDTFMNPIKF